MQAGYDYLLLRSRLQRRLSRYLGIACISFGLLLLAGGGAYYAYAAKAHSDLDDLNVNTVAAATEPREATSAGGSAALEQSTGAPAPLVSASDSGGQTPPKEAFTPDASNHPWIYDPSAFHQQVLVREFTPVGADGVSQGSAFDAATRIMVPSVGIDSTIKELDIMELGDSRAYETPDKVVGHIPETVNPGEPGSSWFFGHTESPIQGEGSVFFNLRQIPEKLRDGQDVFIITDNGHREYLYRVTASQVVHQDDLSLYDTGEATIHLVACVPRWVYDYRLIISGELMAQKIKS